MPLFTGSRLGFGKAVAAVDDAVEEYRVAKSLRFNDDDSANLSKTLSTGSTTTWTYSCWFKLHNPGTDFKVTPFWIGSTAWAGISLQSDKIRYAVYDSGYKGNLITEQVLRDPSAWYHLVAVWDTTNGTSGDRARLYLNGSRITDFDTETYPGASDSSSPLNTAAEHKIGHEASNNKYSDCQFADIHFVDRTALDASSFGETNATTGQWVPIEYTHSKSDWHTLNDGTTWSDALSLTGASSWHAAPYGKDACFNGLVGSGSAGYGQSQGGTNPNSITFTPSGGIAYTSSVEVYIINAANKISVNGGGDQTISANQWVTVASGSGTLTSLKFERASTSGASFSGIKIDGIILIDDAADNSFHLKFGNTSDLGEDSSGNNNDWTANNLSATAGAGNDVLADSPSTYDDSGNGVGNYATLNPLDSATTLSNGNLTITGSGSAFKAVRSTIGMKTGKWYFEGKQAALSSATSSGFGIWDDTVSTGNLNSGGGSYGNNYLAIMDYGGNIVYVLGGSSTTIEAGSVSAGDIFGFALDLDNGTLKVHQNGTYLNSGNSIYSTWPSDRTYFFGGYEYNSGNTLEFNFGQRDFEETVPTGYKALNTFNLDAPAIDDPSAHFDIVAWTATSTNPRTITTPGEWTPDLVWHKMTSNTGSHYVWDKVRGFGNNGLIANTSAVEGDQSSYYTMADATNGFSIQQDSTGDEVNKDGRTYVSWMWNAGGSNTSKTVGSENSNAYNTSQTWSSNLSVNTGTVTDATKAFDGSIVYADNATSSSSAGSDDRSITATLGITLNNDYVEVYPKETYSGYYATIDGVAQTTQYFTTPNGWKRMGPFTGTLTSVTVTNGTETSYRGAGIRAIKVADKILIDDGVTPATDFPSIASTVRASTTAGFSIVSYTGNNTNPSTVAHGLNAKPAMIWVKDREQVKDWVVYHKEIGATKLMYLNSDSDLHTASYGWDDTEPTSHSWSMQDFSNMNSSAKDYIAFCWSEVPGFSKFGSYTGNGVVDGPFIHCGFTPRYLLLKQAHSGYNGSWVIYDTARTPLNSGQNWLYANSTASNVIGLTYAATVTSNGFKMRSTSAENNGSGRNYIFAAWAESPFKHANAR